VYWNASTSSLGCASSVQTFCNSLTHVQTTYTSYAESTVPSDSVESTFLETTTATTTISDANFGIATFTTTYTTIGETFIYYVPTATYVTTIDKTYTDVTWVGTISTIPGITPPPCTLPTSVPQCQSQWDSYIAYTAPEGSGNATAPTCTDHTVPDCSSSWSSYYYATEQALGTWWADVSDAFTYSLTWPTNRFGPACTQASVPAESCSSIKSDLEAAVALGNLTAWRTSTITPSTGVSVGFGTAWPSNFTFAPGCTLGCSACRITGGSVRLLYWPPATAQPNNTAIGSQIVTAVYDDVTLTSPTVYVSFAEVHAQDSCSTIGKTYSNTIVALTTSADLSSLWGYDWYNPAHLSTASFNYSDLYSTPVPDSIYNSQPRCASSSFFWSFEPGYRSSNSSTFSCDRVRPYEPILSVPIEVRNLDPSWGQCMGAIEGIYDPPKELQPVSTIAGPSGAEAQPTTTSATPGSVAQPTTPAATQTTNSPTAGADSLPSSSAVSAGQSSGQQSVGGGGSSPNAASTQPAPQQSGQGSTGNNDPSAASPANAGGVIASLLVSSNNDPGATANAANGNGNTSPVATVGGQTVAQDVSNSAAVIVGSQTIKAGDPGTVISGTTVSLGASGLVIGGSTVNVPHLTQGSNAGQSSAGVVLTIGSQTFAASAVPGGSSGANGLASSQGPGSAVVIDGITLSQGGSAAVINGQTVTLGPSGVVVGTGGQATIVPVGAAGTSGDPGAEGQAIPAGGATFTAITTGGNVILEDGLSTMTLAPGAEATFDGQGVSALSGGGGVVVGGSSTIGLSTQGASSGVGQMSTMIIGGEIVTVISDGNGSVVLEDALTTLTVADGSEATLGTQTLSVGASGNVPLQSTSTVGVSRTAAASSNPRASQTSGAQRPWLDGVCQACLALTAIVCLLAV
jgi:hypothetical protein